MCLFVFGKLFCDFIFRLKYVCFFSLKAKVFTHASLQLHSYTNIEILKMLDMHEHLHLRGYNSKIILLVKC